MHYFGIPRHTQSVIAYNILSEYSWKFQRKIALLEFCSHSLLDKFDHKNAQKLRKSFLDCNALWGQVYYLWNEEY